LEDLARLDLQHVSPGVVQEEAALKGFQAHFQEGTKVHLTDALTGEVHQFNHSAEAYAYLGNVRRNDFGPRLESEVEQLLGIGKVNQIDPEVDTKAFVQEEFTDAAVEELLVAKRPLVEVYVKDFLDDTPVNNMVRVVEAMEKAKGIPANTFHVVDLGSHAGRRRLAIYNKRMVDGLTQRYQKGLSTLGVRLQKTVERPGAEKLIVNSDTTDILKQAGALPDGLDVFKGRDPESALTYTWYKHKGQRDLFMKGKLQMDAQGPYRVFPPELKKGFGRIC
jgi:hypothetical protein